MNKTAEIDRLTKLSRDLANIVQTQKTQKIGMGKVIDELLAALEEIAGDGHRVEFHRNKRVQHHAELARAAIAKATKGATS